VLAHIGSIGDRRPDAEGWLRNPNGVSAIEGFSISCADAAFRRSLTYQIVSKDGSLGPLVAGGAYCGTKGQNQMIFGFVIHQSDPSEDGKTLVYEGVFRDGTRSGPISAGRICTTATRAPLTAMRVTVNG
jgi:hypothetical protein